MWIFLDLLDYQSEVWITMQKQMAFGPMVYEGDRWMRERTMDYFLEILFENLESELII